MFAQSNKKAQQFVTNFVTKDSVECLSRYRVITGRSRSLGFEAWLWHTNHRNTLEQDIHTNTSRLIELSMPAGLVNRVPALAGMTAGASPLSGGR